MVLVGAIGCIIMLPISAAIFGAMTVGVLEKIEDIGRK